MSLRAPWEVVEQGKRMIKKKPDGKTASHLLKKLDCLPPPANAAPSVKARYAKEGEEEMFRELVIVPMDKIPLRIAKFDVALQEKPLWAVYAYRTILERMLLFDCNICRECFPTFHPAYDPSEQIDLQLMRRSNKNVAQCNIEVAAWEDVPPLHASPEELLVASKHEGRCWACHVDIEKQVEAQGGSAEGIVPNRSFLNGMNPLYNFPGGSAGEQLRSLFASATVLEAMLVALEHMQVSYVTARYTRLPKFVKNVISFPQDIASFAKRLALLCEYRVGDRVNSVRGPENGDDKNRAPKSAQTALPEDLRRFAVDEDGYLVYPAKVVEVLSDGSLKLAYEDAECNSLGATGVEWPDQVSPRVTMPWNPRFLKGQTKILLRRNMRGGQKLEGLEVRWRLVSNILRALITVGHWRLDGEEGPMHRYYDKRLFHVPSVEEILEEYAPQGEEALDLEANTAEGLLRAGFDVGGVGGDEEDDRDASGGEDVGGCEEDRIVEKETFDRWLTLTGQDLGDVVQKWWCELPPAPEGDEVGLRRSWGDNSADLFAAIRAEVSVETKCVEGGIPVRALTSWLAEQIGESFSVGGSRDEEALLDQMLFELKICEEVGSGAFDSTAGMEEPEGGHDPERESLDIAQGIVHGWPTVEKDPTVMRQIGRFVKAFPLKFPMGIGDLHESKKDRPVEVSGPEWLQHMLRLGSRHMFEGEDGARCVWAMVNTILISEAAGKGFVVHKQVMKRFGSRVCGNEVLSKTRLRELLNSEETARALVYNLQNIGRDVRTTPMHWSYEGKKLDCAVKHLGWRPPWVERRERGGKKDKTDRADKYLGSNSRCPDMAGHGRIPVSWWTSNLAYNKAYEIHRLNARSAFAKEAVVGDPQGNDANAKTRFEFVRNSPDLVAFMNSLRTELQMRMVMPTLVPHSRDDPFWVMARAEWGAGANPHHHGFLYGSGNPKVEKDMEDDKQMPLGAVTPECDQEDRSDDGKSEDEQKEEEIVEEMAVGVHGPEDNDVCVPCGRGEVPFVGFVAEAPELLVAGNASDTSDGTVQKSGRGRKRQSRLLRQHDSAASSLPDAGAAAQGKKKAEVDANRETKDEEKKREEKAQKRSDAENAFWEYFQRLVSEWNPCFDDEGRFRYVWDGDVGAHDVHVIEDSDGPAQPREPERVRLREVLDRVLGSAVDGEPIDLEPIRSLIGKLVQSSGRHKDHGREGPKIGVDPCARGSGKCPFCRYGFPHETFCRDGQQKVRFEKRDQEGGWSLKFPRNDPYCNSYEPHFLLANLGNVDFRPCLNLWAVAEYITKYATKAPKGSRRLGEVLKGAVDEVCKYGKEEPGVDLLRQSLQKVFARTLGDRDFSLFEAVHVGLGLPLVFDLLPTCSLNTYGTRRVKPQSAVKDLDDDEDVRYDSKLDKFDKRLAIVRAQNRGKRRVDVSEEELRDVSLYEFYWKYYVKYNRICRSNRPVALMVTPGVSADCANVTHARHEMYARTCVVAYWRLMPKKDRHDLYKRALLKGVDEPCLGGTEFKTPFFAPGTGFDVGRYLGVQDLVAAFDGRWGEALMEMLVDPILVEWVPNYVREQYERWNPYFGQCLRAALDRGSAEANAQLRESWKLAFMESGCSDEEATEKAEAKSLPGKLKSNRKLLAHVRREMVKLHERALLEKRESALEEEPDDDGAPGDASSESDEDPEIAAARAQDEDLGAAVDLQRDELPSFGQVDGPEGDVDAGEWRKMSLEAQVSAAGPAAAAKDVVLGAPASASMLEQRAGENEQPYDWFGKNLTSVQRAEEWEKTWKLWKGSAVDDDVEVPDISELDEHGQRFLYDLMDAKSDERDRWLRESKKFKFKPARVICAGTAGSGKSHVLRSIVKQKRRRAVISGVDGASVRGCCVLGAPTGSASFQMKFGAATAHRTWAVPCMRPFANLRKDGPTYRSLHSRLKLGKLFILDERSMIGRMFLGKIAYRSQEALGPGEGPEGASLGFRDFLMVGDDKQIEPIGDSCLFVEGGYQGKAKKADDGPEPSSLVGYGMTLRDECEDVVILRGMHRRDDGKDIADEAERKAYCAEADEFVRVCRRMADCEWTRPEHAWLSQRNRSVLIRTEEGRKEYASFRDAILLMDGRKRNAEGKDGAEQLNAVELRRLAQQRKVPIACWRALHTGYEKDSDPCIIADEDFQGLQSRVEMCEGARILLTSNLWVEAGLVNGAMGTVRGFVWPEGGHPGAKDTKKSMPLCVIVEFDDVKLKGADGEERSFFPGEPDKKKWVPIFRQDAASTFEEGLVRWQFPLVLAWAITHWKAQGMTLPRARVRLSARTAGQHGVGFVACTRVRHPRHMVFEEDLPDWEAFQAVRDTATFHRRRRFELRLFAKASKTIRKYRFYGKDPWSKEDARRAEKMLQKLEVECEMQKKRLPLGRRIDRNAFLWDGEPDYASFLDDAAKEVAGSSVAELAACRQIKDRLLTELHLPAVKEVLGALIPEWLHPSQDDPKKRGKKRRGAVSERVGVDLSALGWKLSVFREEALRERKPVAKDTMEFFLILARLVSRGLDLPVAIGSHTLGKRLAESVARQERHRDLIEELKDWQSFTRSEVTAAKQFLLPVPLHAVPDCREWVLLVVSSAKEGETLGEASKLRVKVAERSGGKRVGERIAPCLQAIIHGRESCGKDGADVEKQVFPADAVSWDTTLAVLGLVWAQVADAAGVSHLDVQSSSYLPDWRDVLADAFAYLRRAADARGDGAVEKSFTTRADCTKFLEMLGSRQKVAPEAVEEKREKRARKDMAVQSEPQGESRMLRLLTWNIAGRQCAQSAPESWRLPDKLCAMRREILRLKPDVLALQECPGEGACAAVPEGMKFVGSVEGHPEGCYAQLYCRADLDMQVVELRNRAPAVVARCTLHGIEVMFVSAHLFPHEGNEAVRAGEVKEILSRRDRSAIVLMGDLNVRREEVEPLCEKHGLRAMRCSTATWNAGRNKFHEELKNSRACYPFDQIWTAGALWVEGHAACACKEYRAGKRFYLSDHFALFGLLDVHAAYGEIGGGASALADKRREVLGGLRTSSAASENLSIELRERAGEFELGVQADREERRELGKKMKAQAKARKDREERLRKDRDAVFGEGSLFAMGLETSAPQAASSLDLEPFRGLSAAEAPEIWKDHVRDGQHALTELLSSRPCWIDGSQKSETVTYVTVCVQMLLRIPAVSAWLSWHDERHRSGEPGGQRCVSCLLWASRLNFGQKSGPGFRKTLVPLFGNRGLVSELFERGGEHDVCDFAQGLLQEMRRLEIAAARAIEWPVVEDKCTHVDRLFACVCEERRWCTGCYALTNSFASSSVLSLPVPLDASSPCCVTDLYTEFCRLASVSPDESSALRCVGQCASVQEHWVQRRLAFTPNVLVIRVPRFDASGKKRSFPLELEEQLFLPGLEAMDLFGAVYYDGEVLGSAGGKYMCLCRGPDGQFWEFSGKDRPSRPMEHITNAKSKSSCLVVYTRPRGGSVFAGASAKASASSTQDASRKEAEAVRVAVGEIAQTVASKEKMQEAAGKSGNGESGSGRASWDVPSKDWAQVVAMSDWSRCLLCQRIWHKQQEVSEGPKDSGVVAYFRCSACEPLISEATAAESDAKKRRLAEEAEGGSEEGEGIEMEDAPQQREKAEEGEELQKPESSDMSEEMRRKRQALLDKVEAQAESSADAMKRYQAEQLEVRRAERKRKAAEQEESAQREAQERDRKMQAEALTQKQLEVELAAKRDAEGDAKKKGPATLDITLPYRDSLMISTASAELQSFLESLFPRCDPAVLRTWDAGGGGDCLFHATAAALEYILQYDAARPNHVLKSLLLADFDRGKGHLVQLLRGKVADHLVAWGNEDILNLVLSCANQRQLRMG